MIQPKNSAIFEPTPNFKEDCGICLNPITKQDGVGHEVNHIFHRTCIGEWFNKRPTCPTCRAFVGNVSVFCSLSEKERDLAVIKAANERQLEALLANGAQISIEYRSRAVYEATLNGRLETVRELLANDAQISMLQRGNAVWQAAGGGYGGYMERPDRDSCLLELVKVLLANGAQILPEARAAAIRMALIAKNPEIANFLSQQSD